MKKPTRLINIFVIVQLITLICNVGTVTCQDKVNLANTQYQAENIDRINQAINNNTAQDDKNIGVRIIELVIMNNLNKRYQRLDPEELEDMLGKRK